MYEFLIGVSDSQTNRAVLVLVIFLHLARTTQKKMLTLLLLPSTNTKDAFKQHVKKSEGVLFNFRSDGIKHALRSLRNDAFRSEKSTPGSEKSEGQLPSKKKKHVLFLTLQHFATQGLRCFAAEDTSKHQGSRLLPVHTGVGLLAQEVDLGRCEGLKT